MIAGSGPPGQSQLPASISHDIGKYEYRYCGWPPARQNAISMAGQALAVLTASSVLETNHGAGLRHSRTWVKLSGAATSRWSSIFCPSRYSFR